MDIRRTLKTAACSFIIFIVCAVAIALFTATYPSSGELVKTDGALCVDYTNIEKGYLMIKGEDTDKKQKLRIGHGEELFTYDVTCNYAVYPLQCGSGDYDISLYKNVKDKQYSLEGTIVLSASLENELGAFLCPNLYVDYDRDTPAVMKAEEICSGLTSDEEIFETVKAFVSKNCSYDFIKAYTITGGEMPDIDGCFEKQMGVCQDLSALTVCMLRSVGVPAKLVIGLADKTYHAWVGVFIDGEEQLFDPTLSVNGINKPAEYIIERYY